MSPEPVRARRSMPSRPVRDALWFRLSLLLVLAVLITGTLQAALLTVAASNVLDRLTPAGARCCSRRSVRSGRERGGPSAAAQTDLLHGPVDHRLPIERLRPAKAHRG